MADPRPAPDSRIPRDDLTTAVDAFLSRPGLSRQTRRSYVGAD